MDITLTLTPQEQQALVQLIDAALRQAGANVLGIASVLNVKMLQAQQKAAQPEQ